MPPPSAVRRPRADEEPEAQQPRPEPPAPAREPAEAVLALQRSAGNAAVARMLGGQTLARQEAATADPAAEQAADATGGAIAGDEDVQTFGGFDMKAAIGKNWDLAGKKPGFVDRAKFLVNAPMHNWFPRTPKKPYEKAFANQLFAWQLAHGLEGTGALDEDTVASLQAAMEPGDDGKTIQQRMNERDREQLAEADAAGTRARNEGEEAMRSAIASAALGEVGKVLDADRGDGKKYGADRLKAYYRETVPDYSPSGYDKGIETVGWWPGGTKAGEKRGAWSWCGIFAMWAIKRATGVGGWAGGPMGLELFVEDPSKAQKGDLLYKKGDLQHRCIVIANDGKNVTTVNGNGNAQSIHIQTLPVSDYHGFHDVMKSSQAQYDKDLEEFRRKQEAAKQQAAKKK